MSQNIHHQLVLQCIHCFIIQAKRPTKASSFSEPGAPSGPGNMSLNRASKNLRRSRNAMGRGLPKKGRRHYDLEMLV